MPATNPILAFLRIPYFDVQRTFHPNLLPSKLTTAAATATQSH